MALISVSGALRAWVLQDLNIAGIIGTKMFSESIPEGKLLPCITYQHIQGAKYPVLSGDSGVTRTRIQYTCWAATFEDAYHLRRRLRDRLVALTGSASGVQIQSVTEAGQWELRDPATQATECILDVYVEYEEEPWS